MKYTEKEFHALYKDAHAGKLISGVIRLYDKDGNHTLSLVHNSNLCISVDLAEPDGEVLYCGVPYELFLLFGVGLDIEKE